MSNQLTPTRKTMKFQAAPKYTGSLIGKSGATIKRICRNASTNQDHPDVRITEVSPGVWEISAKNMSGCQRAHYNMTEMIKQWEMPIKKTTSLKIESDLIKIQSANPFTTLDSDELED
jgi:hypothetical protein